MKHYMPPRAAHINRNKLLHPLLPIYIPFVIRCADGDKLQAMVQSNKDDYTKLTRLAASIVNTSKLQKGDHALADCSGVLTRVLVDEAPKADGRTLAWVEKEVSV